LQQHWIAAGAADSAKTNRILLPLLWLCLSLFVLLLQACGGWLTG
jgi:hypothetical protein